MRLLRGLPNCRHTEPVPYCILIHDDLGKNGLGEKADELTVVEDPHPIDDREPPIGPGTFSIRFIDDQKAPPGRKVQYTSRKLSVGPGQKYTVSNAVARSNAPFPKGRRDTFPCKIRQRPVWSPSRFTRLACSTAISEPSRAVIAAAGYVRRSARMFRPPPQPAPQFQPDPFPANDQDPNPPAKWKCNMQECFPTILHDGNEANGWPAAWRKQKKKSDCEGRRVGAAAVPGRYGMSLVKNGKEPLAVLDSFHILCRRKKSLLRYRYQMY